MCRQHGSVDWGIREEAVCITVVTVVSPGASAAVPLPPWCPACLPARAGTALSSAAAQGVLSYRNVFQEILSLML